MTHYQSVANDVAVIGGVPCCLFCNARAAAVFLLRSQAVGGRDLQGEHGAWLRRLSALGGACSLTCNLQAVRWADLEDDQAWSFGAC